MDTRTLKSFAPAMRRQLMDGVRQRMRYWGFTAEEPAPDAQPQPVEGGYLFRGEVIADATVPDKWIALKQQVRAGSVEDVIEEAAYTWFNRLVAIRILEKNGYDPTILGYAEGTTQPTLLYQARQGLMPYADDPTQERVRQALLESDDSRAFGHLLVAYCQQHDLLRHVFGRVSDYTELLLPTTLLEANGPLHRLVATDAIPEDAYGEVELIGWLYQFYIAEKKQAVYDSKKKFAPADIPAATQIFTPRWIVRYLVENTLGKLYLQRYPESPLRHEMDYLVEGEEESPDASNGAPDERAQGEMFVETDPATGSDRPFERLQALRLFDPAAGSGHILVVAFELLLKMYREQGYTDRDAAAQILQHNVLGLDIDRRAAQLARFALLMKAAQYDRRVLRKPDLQPRVHAMPERQVFSTSDLTRYFGEDTMAAHGKPLQKALTLLADHGQNVGSALKLTLSAKAREAIAGQMAHWEDAIAEGTAPFDLQALHGTLGAYLQPLLLMTGTYPAVAANPPYMGNRKMNGDLKGYLKKHYPRSKKNLFAVFIELMLNKLIPGGRLGTITMESWMFLSSFEDLRYHLLDNYQVEGLAHFGWGILGIEFGTAAALFRNAKPSAESAAEYSYLEEDQVDPDTSAPYNFPVKDNDRYAIKRQKDFEKIPGAPIAYWVPEAVIKAFEENPKLAKIGKPRQGLATGDNKRFLRYWPEVGVCRIGFDYESREEAQNAGEKWFPYNKGGGYRKWYGNLEFVVNWENDGRAIRNNTDSSGKQRSRPQNTDYYFKEGITWSFVSSGDFGVRYTPPGAIFDVGGSSLFPDGDLISYTTAFLNSQISFYSLKVLNPTMNFQVGNLASLPFKIAEGNQRERIDDLAEASIQVAKSDFDSRETSWDFTQHPLIQKNAPSLEAAYTAWQEQATDDFLQLHANEEELNDLFIDLYGLQDELSPRVALGDITILDDELDWNAVEALDAERDRLSDDDLCARFLNDDPNEALFKMEVPIRQLLSYGIGVMLGRYRLGKDGLHIAHPNPSSDELAPYEVPTPLCGSEPEGTAPFEIDQNAIVPLMGSDSPFSDDAVYRMREILRLLWGEEQLTATINFINRALSIGASRGYVNPKEQTMEDWLVNEFWDYHRKLYSVPYYGKKPIYWLFQSPKGYFQVLVYMHRLTKYTPQQIRQQYLHPYQKAITKELEALDARPTGDLSPDETKRLELLQKKSTDARAYDDILKTVAAQQIEIDLDDGVQENYPMFGEAVAGL